MRGNFILLPSKKRVATLVKEIYKEKYSKNP